MNFSVWEHPHPESARLAADRVKPWRVTILKDGISTTTICKTEEEAWALVPEPQEAA